MGIISSIIELNSEHKHPEIKEKNAVYFNNKSGFRKLVEINDINQLAELVMKPFKTIDIQNITGYINSGEEIINKKTNRKFKHPGACKTEVQKNNFSATIININGKNEYNTKPEDNLERIIKLSFHKLKKECENQIPIPDLNQASHIDLLRRNDKTIEFIELKQWTNPNNPPTWAIAECIKNLYLYLHFNRHLYPQNQFKYFNNIKHFCDNKLYDISNIKTITLTILAPIEYYEEFFKYKEGDKLKSKFGEFCKCLRNIIEDDLRRKLSKTNLKIEIKIMYFNFSKNEYESIKDAIIEHHVHKPGWKVKGKKQKSGKITQNTGDINLQKYFLTDKYFSKNLCDKIINWELYITLS